MSIVAIESKNSSRIVRMPGNPVQRLARWFADPLAELLVAQQLGDVVVSNLGASEMWQLFHPTHIERVLVRNAANYTKDTHGYRAMRLALGDGLLTSQGESWKRQRRIANPAFHRNAIEAMGRSMVECAEDLATDWAQSDGTERDVAHDMMAVTLRIAGRTFFSVDVHGGEAERIGMATANLVRQFLFHMSFPFPRPEYLPTPGNYAFWQAKRTLDADVYRMLRERRALSESEQPHDLMSLFLGTRDEETGQAMTDEQLRDELVTMLVAGHETTANALAWTLHLLAEHPVELARVQAELDQVLGGRAPTAADVRALPLLGRAIDESIRLYPPAWLHARRTQVDDSFDGVTIPAGAIVILPQYAVHRDERWWSDPESFDPDRFSPERSEGRPRFAYFPFSGGQRKCIGDRFAQMEAVLVLATLLQQVNLRSVPGREVSAEAGVTLRPRSGIWQVLSAREPIHHDLPRRD